MAFSSGKDKIVAFSSGKDKIVAFSSGPMRFRGRRTCDRASKYKAMTSALGPCKSRLKNREWGPAFIAYVGL